ncbi:MAG: ROK family protein [Bifidobacteriaceae bacterium]|nr:ROK family protein [Bifidobacteriaceae bacterium]
MLAVDLGGTKCHGVVAGLNGVILSERKLQVGAVGSAELALRKVCDWLSESALGAGHRLTSLVVGVPAVINPATGLAMRGPNIGWDAFDLGAALVDIGLPHQVDNDANLAALAEQRVGDAQGVADFALISIGTGVGGAVVSDGRLLRGAHHAAGEFAALVPDFARLGEPAEGLSEVERVLSGPGISEAALRLARAEGLNESAAPRSAREVFTRAAAGERLSAQVVATALRVLATCVSAACAVTDPALVILDGSVGRAFEPFLPQLRELVARSVPVAPRIAVSRLTPTATIRGAICSAPSQPGGSQ